MFSTMVLVAALGQSPSVADEAALIEYGYSLGYSDAVILSEVESWAWSNGMTTSDAVTALDAYIIPNTPTDGELDAWHRWWVGWRDWFWFQPAVPQGPPAPQ